MPKLLHVFIMIEGSGLNVSSFPGTGGTATGGALCACAAAAAAALR